MVEDAQPRLHLADLRDITGEKFNDMRRSIRSRLRDQGVLFSADYHTLLFHTLALFDFDTAPAYDDHQALNELSLHVLTLLDAYQDGQDLENVERTLVWELLGVRTTPGGERERLLKDALDDLTIVERNLEDMRQLPGVDEYVLDPHQRPRNHESRTNVEFYRRNLEERAAITRYLTFELDEAALRAADEDRYLWGRTMFQWFEAAPYPMKEPYGKVRLRFDRIDVWHHRVLPLKVSIGRRLGDLYAEDKERFYIELHKHIPPASVFDRLERATKELPRLGKRKRIFDEFRTLFDGGLWHAFYALTFTQVEGLFAEMLAVVDPFNRTPQALTEKVIALRTIAPLHEHSYDYFQYVLPRSRNVFLHREIDERMQLNDVQLACYDLLHDMGFLVQLFEELEDPVVWLHRITAQDEVDEEINLKWLARFIATLEYLHERITKMKQRRIDSEEERTLLAKADEYANRRFKANETFEDVVPGLLKRFTSLADGLTDAVRAQTATLQGGPIDLNASDARIGQEDEVIIGIVRRTLTSVDAHDELLPTAEQIGRITKRFDWLSVRARDAIEAVRTERSRFIGNFKLLVNARD